MATTAAIFTLTVGTVYRYRPCLYGAEGGGQRSGAVAADSFFGRHMAYTANATFLGPRFFTTSTAACGPSPAAVMPVVVAFFRLKVGQQFLTDNQAN